MEKKIKVIVVGPSHKMKGGITTVIDGYKSSQEYNNILSVKYFATCIDGNKFIKLLYMVAKAFFYPFVLLFFRPTILHVHSAFGTSFRRKNYYIWLSKIFAIKVINHVHGAEWDYFFNNASNNKKQAIIKKYNRCDLIIVLSDEWKKRFLKIVPNNKILVLPNFVSIKDKDVYRKEHDSFIISFIGEFCSRKGCFNIPSIIERLTKEKEDVQVFLGGYGEIDRMNDLINKHNLFKTIKVLGYLDYKDKVDLLAKTDLFLFPSYNEGVPMVLLEAMRFGIPCVSTSVGGIPSIINEEIGNGVTFDPNDFDGMANEIIRIIHDKNYYDCVSDKNVQISSKYTLANSTNLLIYEYRKLVERK